MSRSPTIRSAALSAGLKRRLYRAVRDVRHPGPALERRRIRDEVAGFLGGRDVLDAYEGEVRGSGLMEHLLAKGREHHEAVAASGHSLGAIGYTEGAYLYALFRARNGRTSSSRRASRTGSRPRSRCLHCRRTAPGICTRSTCHARSAASTRPGTFFEGDGRAGIPPGSEPGWLIPPPLKERWTLMLGRSQEELPPLLERLGTVDTFMHDSEHSFDCMWFEFNAAWPALRAGGVLVSDDVNSTEAFGALPRRRGPRTRAARPRDGPAAEVI